MTRYSPHSGRFLVCFCAPDAPHDELHGFWDPKVATPMLQVAGQLDTVVDVTSCQALTGRFCDGRLLFHYGDHFVPKEESCIRQVAEFVIGSLVRPRNPDLRDDYLRNICRKQAPPPDKQEKGRLSQPSLQGSRAITLPQTMVALRNIGGRYRRVVMVVQRRGRINGF